MIKVEVDDIHENLIEVVAYIVSHNEKTKVLINSTLPHVKTLLLWLPTLFPQKLKTATLLLFRKTKRAVVTVIVAQNQTRRCNGYCCAKPNATIVENATLSIEKVERLF